MPGEPSSAPPPNGEPGGRPQAEARGTVERLRERFGSDLLEGHEFRGDHTLVVRAEALPRVAQALRDQLGFESLVDLCGVDYYPREPRFEVVYHFLSLSRSERLRVKVRLPADRPEVPSVVHLYPMADWAEREAFDLVGIRFQGHPDLRRIFMPEDWPGHPLQRTHPLGYEEVQFSHNFWRIDRLKPYAEG